MIKNKKILAIIPARKNSKRVKNKNVVSINNKPLVSYAIESALKSKFIDKIIVSSDDKKIINISKKLGIKVSGLRPANLSRDKSKTIDVIKYEINKLRENNEIFDYVILLQPTSPLRTYRHIDESISMLIKKNAKCIVSVCELEHPIEWTNTLHKNLSMSNFLKEGIQGKRSQDFKKNYRLNGAIFLSEIKDVIKQNKLLLSEKSYAYVMPILDSIDIDNELDINFVKYLIKKKNG
tara:strand:+ start:429 stop:1136 length:708 start_codon:yes stop_codon:yes gene_type:complete